MWIMTVVAEQDVHWTHYEDSKENRFILCKGESSPLLVIIMFSSFHVATWDWDCEGGHHRLSWSTDHTPNIKGQKPVLVSHLCSLFTGSAGHTQPPVLSATLHHLPRCAVHIAYSSHPLNIVWLDKIYIISESPVFCPCCLVPQRIYHPIWYICRFFLSIFHVFFSHLKTLIIEIFGLSMCEILNFYCK